MVTNNVTVYQFEVGLDEVFADEVRFRVNVDCVIVVVVKDCLFFVSFILCENCEFTNSQFSPTLHHHHQLRTVRNLWASANLHQLQESGLGTLC